MNARTYPPGPAVGSLIDDAAPLGPTIAELQADGKLPVIPVLTGPIPCTTPPVRDGRYEFTMFPDDDDCWLSVEYVAGKWVDHPGIDINPDEFYWRGVRRWVLVTKSSISGNDMYLEKINGCAIYWSAELAEAHGFATEAEANEARKGRTDIDYMNRAKAVLP
jgi:hypothetical protein